MSDTARNIHAFFHCRECLKEWKAGDAPGESPSSYARLSVGWTALGLQVVCNRHDLNVVHVDFEGWTHPADTGTEGDFGGTYAERVKTNQEPKH